MRLLALCSVPRANRTEPDGGPGIYETTDCRVVRRHEASTGTGAIGGTAAGNRTLRRSRFLGGVGRTRPARLRRRAGQCGIRQAIGAQELAVEEQQRVVTGST